MYLVHYISSKIPNCLKSTAVPIPACFQGDHVLQSAACTTIISARSSSGESACGAGIRGRPAGVPWLRGRASLRCSSYKTLVCNSAWSLKSYQNHCRSTFTSFLHRLPENRCSDDRQVNLTRQPETPHCVSHLLS